jgi:hypothetical protein
MNTIILRKLSSDIFAWLAVLVFIAGGLWSYLLIVNRAVDEFGFWGAVASIFGGPLTLFLIPFYLGIKYGEWFPFLLSYGAGITAAISWILSQLLKGEK